MVDKIVGPIKPVGPQPERKEPSKVGTGVSFEEILREKELKLSGHASQRIQSRSISSTPNTAERLESAVEKAISKGAQQCLVLIDDTGYLVSIKNRTVITAMSKDELKERIFTSIDSVVIG